jgi:hypothetical protein
MKFDPYEYTSVIVPGSVLVVTLALIFPDIMPSITTSLSLGDLGLVLILAFIAGHFVQAGGNVWESVIWKILGGWPTASVMAASSSVNGGVKPGHCGGAKVGHLGASALERAALI